MWLIGAMVCLVAAPWVQLSVSAGSGWPHNALRHQWLMPISCHFRDCKALLVTSLTRVSSTIANVQTFTFTFLRVSLQDGRAMHNTEQPFRERFFSSCSLADRMLSMTFVGGEMVLQSSRPRRGKLTSAPSDTSQSGWHAGDIIANGRLCCVAAP